MDNPIPVLIVIIVASYLIIALVSAIGAIEYARSPATRPKRKPIRSAFAGLALLFLLIPGAATAQDVAKADEKPVPKVEKALPAKAMIPAEKVRIASISGVGAENASLKVQLLEARIQKAESDLAALPGQIKDAKDQLEKLRESAKKTGDDAQVKSRAMFEAAGIPIEKLGEYAIKEGPDGSLELTLKTAPKPDPKVAKE